ncbi:hypothetical protein [Bombella favorum]|nr:hypothetical protein [Bombella favorum]
MKNDSPLTESSIRKALERMGGGQAADNADGPQPHGHGFGGRSAARARPAQQVTRRRRLPGDDTVVVEHQSLGRSSQKRAANRVSAASEAGQEQERLKQSLLRERRRVHDMEAELLMLNERIRAVNTQMTHLRLQVEEGKKVIQQRDENILRLRAELHQAREQQVRRAATTAKVQAASAESDDEGQQPVQWWRD